MLCSEDDSLAEGQSVDQIRIWQEDDFRFELYRHWSLYEAILHSRYVASRLATWTQSGVSKLQNLLAKMGYALDQCKQLYLSMVRGVYMFSPLPQTPSFDTFDALYLLSLGGLYVRVRVV